MDSESKAIKRSLKENSKELIKKRRTIISCNNDSDAYSGSSTQASCESQNENDKLLNIDSLPDDVLLILLSYLNTTDLLHVSRYVVSSSQLRHCRLNNFMEYRFADAIVECITFALIECYGSK
mgnify:CR=1 FL=1